MTTFVRFKPDIVAMDLVMPEMDGIELIRWLSDVDYTDKSISRCDAKMSHFRCYLLNTADKIVSVDSMEAQDDGAAMEMAGQLLLSKHSAFAGIEVWDCARLVGKITSPTDKPCLDSLLKISWRARCSDVALRERLR